MTRCRFKLRLTSEQCLRYYRGQAHSVTVRSDNGLKLAFPASELRRFVTVDGVDGQFEIVFNRQHKLISLTLLNK